MWWNDFWHAEIAELYEAQSDAFYCTQNTQNYGKREATSYCPIGFCVFSGFCVGNHRPAGSAYSADSAWEIIVRQVLRILRVLREANLSSALWSGIFFCFMVSYSFFRTDLRLNRKFVPVKNGCLKNTLVFWFCFSNFAVKSKTSSK